MIGIDTNILYYCIDSTDREKHEKALRILKDMLLRSSEYMVSLQVLAELTYAISIRGKEALEDTYLLIETILNSPIKKVIYGEKELRLSYRTRKIWDSLIAYTYVMNGCDRIYTENIKDMPKDLKIEYVNPFKD